MKVPDIHTLERRIMGLSRRLGAKFYDANFEGCDNQNSGLMGSYERAHFWLADFEEDFAVDLVTTLERNELPARDADRIKQSAWSSWVDGRNARALERCPNAREMGDEDGLSGVPRNQYATPLAWAAMTGDGHILKSAASKGTIDIYIRQVSVRLPGVFRAKFDKDRWKYVREDTGERFEP